MARLAWSGWWLWLWMAWATPALAQHRSPDPKVELKENRPNPVVTSTTIPFDIGSEVCAEGHRPLVDLKIYNVLVQVVAVPVLAGGDDEPLNGLTLECGSYRAFWDGRHLDGQSEVTSGVYYYQLTVDGERYTRKMIVQRPTTTSR